MPVGLGQFAGRIVAMIQVHAAILGFFDGSASKYSVLLLGHHIFDDGFLRFEILAHLLSDFID